MRTFYVLRCLVCDEDSGLDVPMPFESAAARGRWASEHTAATGHDRWDVTDERSGLSPLDAKVLSLFVALLNGLDPDLGPFTFVDSHLLDRDGVAWLSPVRGPGWRDNGPELLEAMAQAVADWNAAR